MKKRCSRIIKNTIIAVFCTFTAFSHCTFAFASNDDEYITYTEYETMQAYQFFKMYGFSADTSYTYNDTYSTNGSISLDIGLTLKGTDAVELVNKSYDDVLGYMIDRYYANEQTFTMDVDAGTVIGQLDPTSTTPSHLTLACSFNNPSPGGSTPYSGTCKDTGFVDVSRYTFTMGAGANGITFKASNSNPVYNFVDYESAGDGESYLRILENGTIVGTLKHNDTGTLSGSGSISLTTTTTNTNKLNYVLPWMKANSIINPEATNNPNTKYRFVYDNNNPFVIAYFSESYLSTDDVFNFEVNQVSSAATSISGAGVFQSSGRYAFSTMVGGMNFVCIETKPNLNLSNYHVITFVDGSINKGRIIPIYVGYKKYMSNNLYRYIYGSDRLIETIANQTNIIENGNSNSQQKGQQLNNQTTQMQNKMTQFQNIEDTAGENMNTALNNINTNPSLLSTNKFLVSADWIRQQFNRLVTNTPFEAVITFCLVFGLGLLLLGKVR